MGTGRRRSGSRWGNWDLGFGIWDEEAHQSAHAVALTFYFLLFTGSRPQVFLAVYWSSIWTRAGEMSFPR